MRRAALKADGKVLVKQYSAQFPEDHDAVPNFFTMLPDLTQYQEHQGRNGRSRKLPLLKEILDRLYEQAVDADYLIYTNVDIALQPHFYLKVAERIEQGIDAFTITRRTISDRFISPDELDEMYSEIGKKHIGFDCFVFRRDAYPKYELDRITIGVPQIGHMLLMNMAEFSSKFQVFRDDLLTFHIGNDGQWLLPNSISPAELKNRQIAVRYMLHLLWHGSRWQHKQLALLFLYRTMRVRNPCLKPFGRFLRNLRRQTK